MSLHILRKKFTVIHATIWRALRRKVTRILKRFGCRYLILRPEDDDAKYKKFVSGNSFAFENLSFGFSAKDYCIIAGFKASEPSLIKGFHKGLFKDIYCPFLRNSDEWIQMVYQDMKDNTDFGDFMFENLTSDSHHNITIN